MGTCCSGSCCCKSQFTETSDRLTLKDILGSWKARWGINRMNYKVEPGLYALGKPDSNSPVFVTANYKMSFDVLRKELSDLNSWILVLDTKGINVWCAAGKGTFGTDELIKRIDEVGLASIVSHMTVIVPQLGAVGVSAHEVQRKSGFKVIYGPVRAADIKEFLKNGLKATAEMRTVRFKVLDRIVLTPMELMGSVKPTLIIFGVMFLLNILGLGSFSRTDVVGYIGALLVGCFLVPLLLPWIPGRAFAFKGWLLGILWAIYVAVSIGGSFESNILAGIAYLLILPAVSAFYAMNFTGASTYTSFSGVLKEMSFAVPSTIASIGIGIVLILVNNFIK